MFRDEYGEVATVTIRYIRNLSAKYLYMDLKIEPRKEGHGYVVRKTDGAVFLAKYPNIQPYGYLETDHQQNVYYFSHTTSTKLHKMYGSDEGIDIVQLNKDYMNVSGCLVNPKGDVLLRYNNTLSGVNPDYGCYTSSGEFVQSSWAVLSLKMFVLKKEMGNFYELKNGKQIIKIKSTTPALTSEVLVDQLKVNGVPVTFTLEEGHAKSIFTSDDMTVFIGAFPLTPMSMKSPAILRIEDERTYNIVALGRAEWPKALKTGLKLFNGYLYGFNTDEIYRIDTNTGVVETLYANQEYSLYDFSVDNNGVLTFSALELRKAQDVLCEIRDGQLKILQTDDSQKIIQLERIN